MIKELLKHYLRTGKLFKKYLKELEKTEKYSLHELNEYQNEKLRKVIKCAYENVPFYRRIFMERGLKPFDIRTKDDLQKLPIINKNIVQGNLYDFRTQEKKTHFFKALTGGTTGTPGVFFRDLDSINFENAVLWRFFKWAGKKNGSRRITLRGQVVCPVEKIKAPFWKYNHFSRELMLSSYHLCEENMPVYINKIREFQPFDLYAYPSTAYLIAEYCKRRKIKLPLSAVFTSSEMVFPYQREVIEQTFECDLYDWYGQVERVSAIGQCEKQQYHIIEDYSITELLPMNNGTYEVIGTTLKNVGMPLIRYRTEDYISFSKKNKCDCGRQYRMVERICGREGDYVRTLDERAIGVAVLTLIPRGINNLIELQYVQESKDEIILKIVCSGKFSKKDEVQLIKNAKEHISHDMKYIIEKVKNIGRSKNGKFIPVVSTINKTLSI